MPIALTLLLLVFWIAVAYSEFKRGNLPLAGIFLLVGIGLTIFRLSRATRGTAQ